MVRIKFVRGHGHYHAGHEVRLEPERADIFIKGGYAEAVDSDPEETKMEPVPENKSDNKSIDELEDFTSEDKEKKPAKRKKPSNKG